MNSQENELNVENNENVQVLPTNDDVIFPNVGNQESVQVPSVELPIDQNSTVQPIQNAFMYTDDSASVVPETTMNTEVPVVDSMQNVFMYAEPGVTVPSGEQSNTDSNVFSYTDLKESTENVIEDNSKQYVPQSKQTYTSNYTPENQKDSKGNFTFMIVFALIMLAIIVALPYIAGYK